LLHRGVLHAHHELHELQSENIPNITSDEGEELAEKILSIFNEISLLDPNHHHHIPSDIDLRSHFAAIQTTTPEKPNSDYDLDRLTKDELSQLRTLLEKARRA
jgi:hypothetical protein